MSGPPDSSDPNAPAEPACPACGRPMPVSTLCPDCRAPLEPAGPPALVDGDLAAQRARYIRAGFWGCLLVFPLVAWMGILPLWVVVRLLEDGFYRVKWYEWYTLPAQTVFVIGYSLTLFQLHRNARRAERFAAGLCGFCAVPLVGVSGDRCPHCRARLWVYADPGDRPRLGPGA